MKKTIKEDNERKVIKQEYLNDNSLYQISVFADSVSISVRFIDSSAIKEHTLTTMPAEKFMTEGEDGIRISEDGKKIAIFRKYGDSYTLDRLYDLEEHEFSVSDFMDLEYRRHFKEPKLDAHLSYMKVKNNG